MPSIRVNESERGKIVYVGLMTGQKILFESAMNAWEKLSETTRSGFNNAFDVCLDTIAVSNDGGLTFEYVNGNDNDTD